MKKIIAILMLSAAPALAQPATLNTLTPSLAFMPPEGLVIDVLNQDPGVRRAGALLNAAQAEAQAREAGPHEFTVHGAYPATTCHPLQPTNSTCNYLQPLAMICYYLQPLATTNIHLQSLATTCIHLQPPAITCNILQPLATSCNHLQPLAIT